jgi:hypothetical protein
MKRVLRNMFVMLDIWASESCLMCCTTVGVGGAVAQTP